MRVGERDLDEAAFAAAVERAAHAAALVDRTLAEGDRVTQFEALTAAAYCELAARGVDVAVVEAGLGGRYDATNVIPSRVQVLTNVGLEHTRWLGPTVTDIAREKLAVVRDGATLVVGDARRRRPRRRRARPPPATARGSCTRPPTPGVDAGRRRRLPAAELRARARRRRGVPGRARRRRGAPRAAAEVTRARAASRSWRASR